MQTDRHPVRRQKLISGLRSTAAPLLLVTNETNVSYLTGFTGDSSYLLLGPGTCILITDGRYTTQLGEECPGLELSVRPPSEVLSAAAARVIRQSGATKVSIEADSVSMALGEKLAAAVKGLELLSTSGLVESLREIKDPDEIREIRTAIRIAEKGFEVLRAQLRGELSERDVATDLEYTLRKFGARGCSFPPIIAVGPRAALPHGRPGPTLISADDFVLVDWGATAASGYKSDLTRIVVTGKLSPKLERVYRVVLKAQQAAIKAIRPGARCCDIDSIARKVIAEAGFGKQFTHGLGHGIGLDIHEGPRLSATSELPLKPGMVVTVEPGIYIEGWGGVRIEDDVLVSRSGCEVLTSVPKDL